MTNIGSGNVGAVMSKYKWVIDDFSQDSNFQSPIFTTTHANRDIQCYLILQPDSELEEEGSDFMSIYLVVNEKITAQVSFNIINEKGKTEFTRTMRTKSFDRDGWGFPEFLSRKYLTSLSSDVLNDGKLTIVCKIVQHDDEEKEVDNESKLGSEDEDEDDDIDEEKQIDKYEAFVRNSDKFSDVSLISSDGKAVKAQKYMLAKSSPVFEQIIDKMEKNHENTVQMPNIEYHVLEDVVRFLYIKKFNHAYIMTGHLGTAAVNLGLDELKDECENVMCRNLKAQNVVPYLVYAQKNCMNSLKKKGIEYAVSNADDVVSEVNFQSLPSVLMSEICRALVTKANNSFVVI